MKVIFKCGYKYQLEEDYIFRTRITGFKIYDRFIKLDQLGNMTIRAGYAWDGCSGPTRDDNTNMRGGLEHDAKCQLMRLGHIPESCKFTTDAEFVERCLEDGMWRIRAWYYFHGVDHFARFACKYGSEQEPQTAP